MSTLFSPVNLVTMVLFGTALAWRVYQVQRAPRRLPNWAVTVTIAAVAGAFLFQQPVIVTWFDALAGRGAARLANNLLLALGLCALLVFFLGSAMGPRPRGRYRRVAVELLPLAAAVAVMFVAMGITPSELRGAALGPRTVHEPGIALFYLGAGSYLVYGLFSCVFWILRYLRTADRNLRIGLRLSAAGLACAGAGSVLRAGYVAIAWAAGPALPVLLVIGAPLVILGTVLFLAGVTYPGARARVAALRRRRQHLRDHRLLAPLWTVLVEAYPSIVLRSGSRRERFRPRAAHRRYYRRVVEIRDGLVQLSPYLDTDLAGLAGTDPDAAAAALRSALSRRAAGEETDGRAKLVLPGGANDIESDVRPLLALSAAVAGHGS